MFELLSNITAARVSVLDLDNAVLFDPGYTGWSEEAFQNVPSAEAEPNRGQSHTRVTKQC